MTADTKISNLPTNPQQLDTDNFVVDKAGVSTNKESRAQIRSSMLDGEDNIQDAIFANLVEGNNVQITQAGGTGTPVTISATGGGSDTTYAAPISFVDTSVVITNPAPANVYGTSTNLNDYIKLPALQGTDSLNIGDRINITIFQPSQDINVLDSDGNLVITMKAGQSLDFTVSNKSIPAGSWLFSSFYPIMNPGQILMGRDVGGSYTVGSLISSDSSLYITPGVGNIDLKVNSSAIVDTGSGSWSPAITPLSGIVANTFAVISARFVKVGNTVIFTQDVTFEANDSDIRFRTTIPFAADFVNASELSLMGQSFNNDSPNWSDGKVISASPVIGTGLAEIRMTASVVSGTKLASYSFIAGLINPVVGGILEVIVNNPGTYSGVVMLNPTIGSGAVLTPIMEVIGAAVVIGGNGYLVNDLLTVNLNSTFTSPATFYVNGTTSPPGVPGSITSIAFLSGGEYLSTAINPTAVSTSGGGTGATFNFGYGLKRVQIDDMGEGFTDQSQLIITGPGMITPASATLVVG